MKKLMFAAAAAFCGTVFALESANIVGYQNRAVEKSGWNLICNTFLPVNGEKSAMKLGDFKPAGWDFWSGDTVQFLDAGGGTASFEFEGEMLDALFTYATTAEGAPADGWYQYDKAYNDMVYVSGDEMSLEYGEGAVYQTTSPETTLVFSGTVADAPQTILSDKSGWNLIGNPTPVDINFADITPDGWDFWSGDTIQFLDAGGGTESFSWTNPETEEVESLPALFTYATTAEGAPADGWYQYDKAYNDMVYISISDAGFADLKAGAGFVSQTVSDSTGIQFPGAL